jgi:hypothetical protein
LVHIY